MDAVRHEWNIADLIETIADVRGDAPMIIGDDRTLSWNEVDHRTSRLAVHLLDAGLVRGDRVGVCTRTSAPGLETYLACFAVGLVPFNVNFRYGVDEVAYLLDNSDARAVVADHEFGEVMGEAARRVGGLATIVQVTAAPGGIRANEGAGVGAECGVEVVDYERTVEGGPCARPAPPWGRSPDDLLFQYTGGTTGLPKAVMWRQGDLVSVLAGTDAPPDEDSSGAPADIAARLADEPRRSCTAAPLVHGTGLLSQLANFFTGGTSVILPGRSFRPAEVWQCVDRHRVNVLVIVGDPFARPLLDELVSTSASASYDLRSLKMITSSGAMFSRPVKEGLLRRMPWVALLDAFGSTEVSGLGVSMSTAGDLDATAVFRVGDNARVLADDGTLIALGGATEGGVTGRIAMPGHVPVGYHKDPVKSAEAYPVIDGVRYSVPGDYVRVDDGGRLTLLGRGSSVINTGGEKVYSEEIEELLKEHPDVVDAAVVAVPDARFGSAVCALVQCTEASTPDVDDLRAHVRARAAGFKVPRHVLVVDDLRRQPNGKLDRTAIIAFALGEITAARPR